MLISFQTYFRDVDFPSDLFQRVHQGRDMFNPNPTSDTICQGQAQYPIQYPITLITIP